jgi:hypothetical protein
MSVRRSTSLALVSMTLAGCTVAGGQAGSTPPSSFPADMVGGTPGPQDRNDTIDVGIPPVSATSPSADARAALEACGAYARGLDTVAAMGEIPSARLAPTYVPLWGVEPEIQTDSPAWIVVFNGRIELGRGYWAEDPVCVVIGGVATTFMPGPYGRGDERTDPPSPPSGGPTRSLPPLAP